MSADNYFVIMRHPAGGYAVPMGFMSDDEPLEIDERTPRFFTLREAVEYATGEYFEYGYHIAHDILDQL